MAACVRSARFVKKTKGEHRLAPWPRERERGEEVWRRAAKDIPRDCATKIRIFSFRFFALRRRYFFPATMATSLSVPSILISAMADWSRRVITSQPRYPFLSSNITQTHNQFFLKQSHPSIQSTIHPRFKHISTIANGPARFPGLFTLCPPFF